MCDEHQTAVSLDQINHGTRKDNSVKFKIVKLTELQLDYLIGELDG